MAKPFTIGIQQKDGSWKEERSLADRAKALQIAQGLSLLVNPRRVVVWRWRERLDGGNSASATATFDAGRCIFDELAETVGQIEVRP